MGDFGLFYEKSCIVVYKQVKSYIFYSKSYREIDGNKIIVSWRSICGSRLSKFDGKKCLRYCIIRFYTLNLSVERRYDYYRKELE